MFDYCGNETKRQIGRAKERECVRVRERERERVKERKEDLYRERTNGHVVTITISAGMGAKTSTVAQSTGGNGQSSTGANETMQGFSMLRSLPGGMSMLQHQHQQANQSQSSRVSGDSRQRARSLSSVPDLSSAEQAGLATSVGVGVGQALGLPQLDSDDADEDSGRVYAAHSLPSHIWSLNGK